MRLHGVTRSLWTHMLPVSLTNTNEGRFSAAQQLRGFGMRLQRMEIQRRSDGSYRVGSSILHEAFSIRRPYCKLRRAAAETLYVCYWNTVPLYRKRASTNERRCILHRQVGTQRRQTSFSYTERVYLLLIRRYKHCYT